MKSAELSAFTLARVCDRTKLTQLAEISFKEPEIYL